ncbi:VOC family protein [Anaerocolumna sp. AGMB13025]|uniref:VOC family protein n=1 Tax=Anaerocolumna sp. AGMB13025 TaxID=3039116 RepID=UPI00241DB7F6|nr:VOC family protein [Anaerocolumna sp. AGMB13025]WFR55781.1 VOC family protein [Anaerocolumna sp. AGMB13025]
MFTHIDHVAISVKDRDKSIAFYENNFGFKQYFEHDVPDVPGIEKVVYLQLGETILELEHWTKEKANSGYHFCLISDDFDADYDRLISLGVPVVTKPHIPSPRTPREKGWKRVVFKGPDDERIEFRG